MKKYIGAVLVVVLAVVGMLLINRSGASAQTKGEQVVQKAEELMPKVQYHSTYDPAHYYFDCSGFVYYAYKLAGMDLGTHDDDKQAKLGVEVPLDKLQVGDIVYFNANYKTNPSDVTHVAIYYGNGKLIHNVNPDKDVVINDLSMYLKTGRVKGARRVIGYMFKNEPPFTFYKVDAGDSFWYVAQRYGLSYQELMKLNPDVDPMNMQVGSSIRLKA